MKYILLVLLPYTALGLETTGTRAASTQVNCLCQCSSTTFKDKHGRIQGNCRSVDHTGAQWCYVDPRYSQCNDLGRSKRFNQHWSYQACATPALNSYQCRGSGGHGSGGGGCSGYGCSGGGSNYPCRGSKCGGGSGFNSGSNYPCRGNNCGGGGSGYNSGGSSYACGSGNCNSGGGGSGFNSGSHSNNVGGGSSYPCRNGRCNGGGGSSGFNSGSGGYSSGSSNSGGYSSNFSLQQILQARSTQKPRTRNSNNSGAVNFS